MPTPVNPVILSMFLQGYDKSLSAQILQGFRDGFHLGYIGEHSNIFSSNLKSAKEAPEIVSQKLQAEIEAGRIAGPFEKPPFPNFRTNPLGLVPKKNGSGFRLIHHLSHPSGNSVNDFIPKESCSVQYATIQDAIHIIMEMSGPVFLAKSDLAHAFRNLPMHVSNYPLLGMEWQGSYYYDKCLPMGGASSCALFESVSTALEWIARKHCPKVQVLHVLDDFIFIASSEELCRQGLHTFIDICDKIGMPIAVEKTVGPSQILQFLGITLDTIKKEARLPPDKVHVCKQEIKTLLGSKRVKLRSLQSVLGRLNFTLSVVIPGRAFLRRLYNLTMGIKKPYHYVRLTATAKADLRLWLSFLENFNGRSFFHSKTLLSSCKLRLQTDSSGSQGYGSVFGNSWFWGLWPERWKTLNIAVLEFYPIVAALKVWGKAIANKNVLFVTDNLALVSVINKQTTKDKHILYFLRILVLECLKLNVCFSAVHVSSKQNAACDHLSRAQLGCFFQVHPTANRNPAKVPEAFLPENLGDMPGI